MNDAAVGFRVHSGWAAMVAVAVADGEPIVLARKRIHLVKTFSYKFRQPYHTAEKMPAAEAGAFVSQVRSEARRLAARAIRSFQRKLEIEGFRLDCCGLLLASGRALPPLQKILASHALIHTADGELFREALLHAGSKCGLRSVKIKEKELLKSASEMLRLKESEIQRRITEIGRAFGSPWSQDEKFASLAAWLALANHRH
ncbi:MAG TPA: hypothetical protein VEG64_14985 [Candidatus Sulfotelmatobacter sp.]|nr:hypothetical protein [Candidatus Sulfotelmatobacter sp.]